jgi:hypothetical protein
LQRLLELRARGGGGVFAARGAVGILAARAGIELSDGDRGTQRFFATAGEGEASDGDACQRNDGGAGDEG